MQNYTTFSQEALTNSLRAASKIGDLDLVKYLLTSPELEQHADIHAHDECIFTEACLWGNLEIVEYILSSPDLIAHGHTYPNVHESEDCGFRWTCEADHLDIIQYLIFDREIQLTLSITKFLHDELNNSNKLGNSAVLKMFENREMHQLLDMKLVNKTNATSNKINATSNKIKI